MDDPSRHTRYSKYPTVSEHTTFARHSSIPRARTIDLRDDDGEDDGGNGSSYDLESQRSSTLKCLIVAQTRCCARHRFIRGISLAALSSSVRSRRARARFYPPCIFYSTPRCCARFSPSECATAAAPSNLGHRESFELARNFAPRDGNLIESCALRRKSCPSRLFAGEARNRQYLRRRKGKNCPVPSRSKQQRTSQCRCNRSVTTTLTRSRVSRDTILPGLSLRIATVEARLSPRYRLYNTTSFISRPLNNAPLFRVSDDSLRSVFLSHRRASVSALITRR